MPKTVLNVKNVIAIGASAGGLDPLQKIIKELPDNLPDTTIIVAQHTSPNYESMLANLLKKQTNLKVSEAKAGEFIEPNHIYTCPPDNDVLLAGRKFEFSKPSMIGPKPSVDKLFISIAKSFQERATGIIISGTGQDGSQGIAEIKKHKGITIAQDPETASYPGMPDSAILTDLIDLILSPSQIGMEIPRLVTEEYRKSIHSENELSMVGKTELDSVKRILDLLHKKTGADFSGYKTSTIHRRLEKRIVDKKYTSVEDYVMEVEDNPAELDQLFLYLLIGVTQFFRNPDSIEVLADVIKMNLIEHPKDMSYRIWVPGCATGEEAYTIAMIIDDLISKGTKKPSQIQIFATDIDQTPLSKARTGKYSESSMKSMPAYFKEKYFTKIDDHYVIEPDIKRYILFSKHDITSNPPFLRLNMVSCRNLLIYFKTPLQNQILPLFHYTLEQNGILFLGKSETIGRFKNLYEIVDMKHKIYRRRQTESSLSHLPLLQPVARKKKVSTNKNLLNEVMTISDMVKETFYNGYEHPYFVVDDGLNVVEINKDVSFYLTLQPGTPNLNAIKLIHKDLSLDLRTLIGLAHNSLGMVVGNYRKVKRKNEVRYARLKVQPTIYSKPRSPYFIVTIEQSDDVQNKVEILEVESEDSASPLVAELEHELAATKEHLNTLVEELETSNEELQSLNEELQSSNEELQASNEELETSNEELQATNEELNVAYNELRSASAKIEEQSRSLSISQNNLKSLLDNTQQAFILISRDYDVVLFNNIAFKLYKEIFNIRLTEGVIYIDIFPSEYLQKFHKKFKEALQGKQTAFEQEVVDNKGQKRYLSFNYTPVESSDNKYIENVSVSFIDITEKKNYEIRLKDSYLLAQTERTLWKNVFDDSPELVAIFSGDEFRVSYANKSYRNLLNNRKIIGEKITDLIPEVSEQGFLQKMREVRRSGKPYSAKEIAAPIDYHGDGKISTRYFNYTYRSVMEPDEKVPSIVLHAVDITPLVEKSVAMEEEQLFLRLISQTLPEHIMVLEPDRSVEFVNNSGLKYYGFKQIKSLRTIQKRVHEDERDNFAARMDQVFIDNESQDIECRIKNARGEYKWHIFKARVVLDEKDQFFKVILSATDVDHQKVVQKNKDDFMGVASHELKTPLTTVKAYTQLLHDHLTGSGDETAMTYLERTNQSVEKLEKFVSDLLDISRIQRGKLTLEKSRSSIRKVIENVTENLQITFNDHELKVELGEENIELMIDTDRIEQVLVNLLNNAAKYSPEGNEIHVKMEKKNGHVVVCVQDFGVGIAESDLESVFDRFFRVSEHQENVSGLGIGLNISKEIIELHGGEIWVESKLKKGSVFRFKLPIDN